MINFYDCHCDTLSRILHKNQSLYDNTGHVDVDRLRRTQCALQCFAIFVDTDTVPNASAEAWAQYGYFAAQRRDDIRVIHKYDDIAAAKSAGQLAALLTIEEGAAVCGGSHLQRFFDAGVRMVTLTWNHDNDISGCIATNTSGLTPYGRELVTRMNQLGVIVDVSHLSDEGFWDVAAVSKNGFIASHSNAKAQCGFRRNLNDEQIKELIRIGGFMGLNLVPDFLRDGGNADLSDILRHVEHILSLGGQHILGLGMDLDGTNELPAGISDVTDVGKIYDALCAHYDADVVEDILWRNLDRVFAEQLPR